MKSISIILDDLIVKSPKVGRCIYCKNDSDKASRSSASIDELAEILKLEISSAIGVVLV